MIGTVLGLLALLAAVNLVTAALFVADKQAAVHDRRRVSERTLLTLGAVGGTPALIALSGLIRHKTRKEPFRTLLYNFCKVLS